MAQKDPKPLHVLIIGAGLGGLVLAQTLRKSGVSFEVFEQDPSADFRGQGFAVGLSRPDELQGLLPSDLPSLRSACHLLPLDLASQVVFYSNERRVGVTDTETTPCIRANRVRLRQILSTAIPIKWGKKAVSIEEVGDSVAVLFSDNTTAKGDLLVGADGVYSAVREHVLKKDNFDILRPIPLAIILGETTLSGEALERQLSLGHSCWFASEPEARLFCGISRILPDGKSAEVYWTFYYDDDGIGDAGHWLQLTLPAQQFDLVWERSQVLDAKFREVLQLTGPGGLSRKPMIFWDAVIDRLPVSRVTMLGDAAHPMAPFRGEGGIHAIRDAVQLGGILGNVPPGDSKALFSAVDQFQRDMIRRGCRAVRASRAAMLDAAAGNPTMVWGFPMVPVPEETITL